MTSDGTVYVVCHADREGYVLSCKMRSHVYRWTRSSALTNTRIQQPTCVAAYGQLLLIADMHAHTVHVAFDGKAAGTLTCLEVHQPSAVATDGELAAVCGSGTVCLFDLASRSCTASWPLQTTTWADDVPADATPFECECGMALHGGRLYVCDRRGDRVVIFDAASGKHLHSIGGRAGTACGELRQPWGVAVCCGALLVSEHEGKRVQAYTLDTLQPVGALEPEGCGELTGLGSVNLPEVQKTPEVEGKLVVVEWDTQCLRILRVAKWHGEDGAAAQDCSMRLSQP